MTDGANEQQIGHDENPTAGQSFRLHSLRPEFVPLDHQLYVDYLLGQLNIAAEEADGNVSTRRPLNVALTGSYGSGKSSVLSKVREDLGDRAISLSLSTLGKEESGQTSTSSTASTDPLKVPAITNAIQKEIVKQLLYREKPSTVPGSRYRRIEKFRRGRAWAVGALVSVILTVFIGVSGAASRLEDLTGGSAVWLSLIYGGTFLAILGLGYVLQAMLHNRVWIEKLSTGSATVSLTNTSSSFFDQYLDEIVYFFETTKYDVVILEDIDRFNDPFIFETLRELNILLNNSKQIQPKTITFVYAIKDSIFEQLGKLSIMGDALDDEAIRELAVTNRTKFFDVVIPVVPFISHRNARDLISQELGKSGFEVSKPLIDLVSKYLIDMRLIKNVHNEYGIFRQKILRDNGIAELHPDALFSMVVYKNLYLADFEEIKRGKSDLDALYRDFRSLINEAIALSESEVRRLQSKLRTFRSVESRSKYLGGRLKAYLTTVMRQSGTTLAATSMTFGGAALDEAKFETPAFWSEWSANGTQVLELSYLKQVVVNYSSGQTSMTFQVTLDDFLSALHDEIQAADWRTVDTSAIEADLSRHLASPDFLKHATMSDLFDHPEFTLTKGSEALSFDQLARRRIDEGLPLTLIRSGFIDRNFSLYVSIYYDDTVSAQARNYILHSVDPNIMDINAEIGDSAAIAALVEEVGVALFEERSIYNIQLMDHLLENNDARLSKTMRQLAAQGDDEKQFLIAYISAGTQVDLFVQRLAPFWKGIFAYLVSDPSVGDEKRISLVDAAISTMSERITYEAEPESRAFLENHFRSLASLVEPDTARNLDGLTKWLLKLDLRFSEIAPLAEPIRREVISNTLYEITEENLVTALGAEADLSLDAIEKTDQTTFEYVTSNLTEYLKVQESSSATEYAVRDIVRFVPIVNQIAEAESPGLLELMGRVPSAWTIVKLLPVDKRAWPAVAAGKRLKTTYENVGAYLEVNGLDDSISASLDSSSSIAEAAEVSEASKQELAIKLANSALLTSTKKAALISSLELENYIEIAELAVEQSTSGLFGALVASEIIEDNSETYAHISASTWQTKRDFIINSPNFNSYLAEEKFSQNDLSEISCDTEVSDSTKLEVFKNLTVFKAEATKTALDALARVAVDSHLQVGSGPLLVLAEGNAEKELVVELIARALGTMSKVELFTILRSMPRPYSRLMITGGSTHLPNNVANLQLADKLIDYGRVSTRSDPPSGAEFKVNLRRKLVD